MTHDIQACEIIGIDIAKSSFAVHCADRTGTPVFKATYSRPKLLAKLAEAPACRIYIGACGGAHHLGREFQRMGHQVGLIPPIYVKPFVKRQKNDANDAAAIVEAASRPTMRVLDVKAKATQGLAALFRARNSLVKQRTQTANSIRGLLAEFGVLVPKGLQNLVKLRQRVDDAVTELPASLLDAVFALFNVMSQLNEQIDVLTQRLEQQVASSAEARQHMEVPGIGPITAFAILAFAGDLKGFKNGREFSAWLGLTPKEHSTGGRHSTGAITKMGQRDLRHLLVSGAMALIRHRAMKKDKAYDGWMDQKLRDKPKKVVAVAVANRMARVAWAMIVKEQRYDATIYCIN